MRARAAANRTALAHSYWLLIELLLIVLFSKCFDLLLQGEKDCGYEDNCPRSFSPYNIVRIKLAVHLECCLSLGEYSESAIALTSHDEIATEFAFLRAQIF
jgi:hypothetical protein